MNLMVSFHILIVIIMILIHAFLDNLYVRVEFSPSGAQQNLASVSKRIKTQLSVSLFLINIHQCYTGYIMGWNCRVTFPRYCW